MTGIFSYTIPTNSIQTDRSNIVDLSNQIGAVSGGTLTLEVAIKKSGMSKEDFVKAMEAAGYKIPVEE